MRGNGPAGGNTESGPAARGAAQPGPSRRWTILGHSSRESARDGVRVRDFVVWSKDACSLSLGGVLKPLRTKVFRRGLESPACGGSPRLRRVPGRLPGATLRAGRLAVNEFGSASGAGWRPPLLGTRRARSMPCPYTQGAAILPGTPLRSGALPGAFMNREPRVRDVRQPQEDRPAAPEPCWRHDEDSGRSCLAADGAQIALAGRGLMNAPG